MCATRKFLLFVIIIGFVYYTEQQKDFAALHAASKTECIKESGVPKEEVDTITADEIINGDQKIKCYQKCMFTKFEVMDDSGEIIDDELEEYGAHFLNATANAAMTKACKDAEGPDTTDLCKVAALLVKCMSQVLTG